jgi:Nif-specific regulatory protein
MTNSPQETGLPTVCFREISTWVNSMLNIDQLLELIIDTATRMMEAKAGSLMLYDEKRQKLYFKVATGEKGEEVRKFEVNIGEGIAGYVAQQGEPLLIPDVKKEPRWDKTISEVSRFETNSIACVPLKIDGKIIGVVEVIDKEDGSPIRQADLDTLSVIADLASTAIVNARTIDRFKRENEGLKEELATEYKIIGESGSLKKAVAEALKVAHTKTSTLILGESGTGKEVLAKLIHKAGPRSSMPMVLVNCAALPENLLESELFGHEKGAFTGAVSQKIGKFELADGGTLFLDEIAEMPLVMQAKLLQVLQEGIFYRVGGIEPITVNVRIIAATNRDIEKEVKEGNFREDLYYRLNVVQIRMPALKERKEDIPLLAGHFLDLFRAEAGLQTLKISTGAIKKMMAYGWPGNVRELRNAIERAVVMGNGKEIVAADLHVSGAGKDRSEPAVGMSLKEAVNAFKKEYIRRNLELAGGNRSKAAGVLNIQRTYLSRLISRYGI